MADLKDGESVEMQGSGSKPYVLKNVGGVYSCTCPAWRNQSLGIERRTCKHLRKLRGDSAEEARIGSAMPIPATIKASDSEDSSAPPLLLAESWDNVLDPTNWWMSEKLDGVRAYWDGKQFWSRLGNLFHAPAWFVKGLPNVPLDGELWLGRKKFQRTVSIVRRQDQSDHWKEVRYVVFDAPTLEKGFEQRLEFVQECITQSKPLYAQPHPHQPCQGMDHLRQELARLEALGGEGLMLRKPGSKYENGRSITLLKVKTFHDAEGRVLKHLGGAGRHKGRLGALLVEMPDGTTFSVGTGFSDAERENPPAVGSLITYRYQELSDGGVPRFPSYVGIRADSNPSPATTKGDLPMATSANTVQRFEFREGSSDKFWEISVREAEVTVRYGRSGSQGQTNVKSFPDNAAARKHADSLIHQKTGKGYVEVP
jgi:DNA ligase 1